MKSQRKSRLRHCEDRPEELLGTFGTCDSDGECPHLRLRSQFEPQEGAAHTLCNYQVCYQCQPPILAGDAESISISNFLGCSKSGLELCEKCCFPLAKLGVSQAARYRIIIRHSESHLSRNRLADSCGCRYCIPPLPPASKRLAGGTTPFILRYSTICP